MDNTQKYLVTREGFLLGTYRKAEEAVWLTPKQAKYFLPPHDTRLTPPPAATPPEPPAPLEDGEA